MGRVRVRVRVRVGVRVGVGGRVRVGVRVKHGPKHARRRGGEHLGHVAHDA